MNIPSYSASLISRRILPLCIADWERDGFTVEDGTLRRILPGMIDLPAADDEVHLLLDRFGLLVPRGHLDQGITAHVRGQWAAANAQFRTFVESLLDEIAFRAPALQKLQT